MDELDEKQVHLLEEIFEAAPSSSRLSQWEQNFLCELQERFEVYRAKTQITDRQWESLHQIERKLFGAG